MCVEDKVLNPCSSGPVLFEMAKRQDAAGRVSRSLRALADIEKYKHTSPATYREIKAHILENLRGA